MGKRSGNRKGKDKVILPSELLEIDDDEVVVSDEDVEFYSTDKRRADLVRKFDQKSINNYVRRVIGKDEGEVERLYEERERKRKAAEALRPRREDEDLEVDPVDALPIKTLQGELVYNKPRKLGLKALLVALNLKLKKKVQMPSQVFKKTSGRKNLKTKRVPVNRKMFDLKVKN